MNYLVLWCGHSRDSNGMDFAMYLARGCLTILTLGDAIIPLVRSYRVLHPAQYMYDLTRQPSWQPPENK